MTNASLTPELPQPASGATRLSAEAQAHADVIATLAGQPGMVLIGDDGNNILRGGDGDDRLIGKGEGDLLIGGAGNDALDGGPGLDNMEGGFGDDRLIGGEGIDLLYGEFGNDWLSGGTEGDLLQGGGGDDILYGGPGNDGLGGGPGVDVLYGGGGKDSVGYLPTFDPVFVDLAAGTMRRGSADAPVEDTLFSIEDVGGGDGDDTLVGNGGANVLYGSRGRDTLIGGGGNDFLLGDYDDDTLSGGTGNDMLSGYFGNDTFLYRMGDGADTIMGQQDFDALVINGTDAIDKLDVLAEATLIIGLEGGTVDSVETTTADLCGGIDRLSYTGTSVDVTVDLSLGKATGFTHIAGIENVTGGAGDDHFTGDTQANNFAGGAGDDVYVLGAGDTATEYAGGGFDAVFTALANLAMSNHLENLTFTGSGDFTGKGNSWNNVITGGAGNDTLSGGSGDDVLIGGQGNDTLNGGAGTDHFVFAASFGDDIIIGFDANAAGGQDLMDLSAFGLTSANFNARVTIADLGNNTLVTIDGGDTITLTSVSGVGENRITVDDFLLS